ncbi:MAG: hypothetical protein FK733_19340 [Asgard group archaeon]|nr:hypothetical protein [Asgard group archaeon]
MSNETPLEKACKLIAGEKHNEFYSLLRNLLLLNYQYAAKEDPRLSAKVTAILFDNGLKDKAHLICLYLENPEINIGFSKKETDNTKKLLNLDPELVSTQKIVENIIKDKIVSAEQIANLQLIARADLKRYVMEAKARFIYRY